MMIVSKKLRFTEISCLLVPNINQALNSEAPTFPTMQPGKSECPFNGHIHTGTLYQSIKADLNSMEYICLVITGKENTYQEFITKTKFIQYGVGAITPDASYSSSRVLAIFPYHFVFGMHGQQTYFSQAD